MIENNETTLNEESSKGAIGPVSVEKLKEYGMKSYAPLLNVVFKYQDEFTPYLEALAKGLKGGVDSLNQENSSEAERYVGQMLSEAAEGINQASLKLKAKNVSELTGYLTELADRRPSLMFSTSYIAGMFFGRLARHVVTKRTIQ